MMPPRLPLPVLIRVGSKADLRGMEVLRQAAGQNFLRGVILYTGHETLPFGPDCWAVPIDALWTGTG